MKKGRALFREIEETRKTPDFDNPDWVDNNELYNAVTHGFWGAPPILKADLCLYLQEGKRLGRKIEIVNDNFKQEGDITIYITDGNNYHLKLV